MKDPEHIKQTIINYFTCDDRVNVNDIKIEVNHQQVALEGSVVSYATKKIAEKLALEVAGVKTVLNKLRVKQPEKNLKPNDSELAQMITDLIQLNSDIETQSLRVKVTNGQVTLSGQVGSTWQQLLAESEATALLGVSGVDNQLTINTHHKISKLATGNKGADSKRLYRQQAEAQLEHMSAELANLASPPASDSGDKQTELLDVTEQIKQAHRQLNQFAQANEGSWHDLTTGIEYNLQSIQDSLKHIRHG